MTRFRQGTWKIVLNEDIPEGANEMGGRLVLVIKCGSTDKEVMKARLFVQAFRDNIRTSLVQDSATSRQVSARMLVGLVTIIGVRIFSTDVTQAYLQSATGVMHDIYIKPGKDFELAPNQLLKLLEPLYGLSDSRDYWGATFTTNLKRGVRDCWRCNIPFQASACKAVGSDRHVRGRCTSSWRLRFCRAS